MRARIRAPASLIATMLTAVRVSAGPTGETAQAGAAAPSADAKEAAVIKEHRSGEWTPSLTDAEKATLFAIAEDTLAWCVNGSRGRFSFDKYPLTDKLKVKTATFVTLKMHGMLRGCIGSLAPMQPLYESIHANAVNASMDDPRFNPVTPKELPLLEIHLSILSPIRDIATLDEFKIGEHGIIMEKGFYRAVYLPEVAVEQGWTKEETLSSLSEKAGARADAWKTGAHFKVFSSVQLAR
jgi:AmmeMemoRadiSam system protein A